jgi:hypothetical protein
MTISDPQALADRVDELRAWAGREIAACERDEHHHSHTVASAARLQLVTLQIVLRILDGGKP